MVEAYLPSTTLCAIIGRTHSPAGPVQDFIDAHVPYVEKAVIVNNGNSDLTRRLGEMQSRYSNMKVIYRGFDGFANLRNAGLKHVTTDWVLVLDDDELLLKDDFTKLHDYLEHNEDYIGINLPWREINANGKENVTMAAVNPRLFRLSNKQFRKTRYRKPVFEDLFLGNRPILNIMGATDEVNVEIKHFKPHHTALCIKKCEFYLPLAIADYPDEKWRRIILKRRIKLNKPHVENQTWNELNSYRSQYQSS